MTRFLHGAAFGKWHPLSDYRGRRVVLYLYPKNNSPGCSTQACEFRDDILAEQHELPFRVARHHQDVDPEGHAERVLVGLEQLIAQSAPARKS